MVVGGNLGVSRLSIGDPAAQWTRLGANLPNALVNDLEYHASDDVLLVGTFGRGAWLVENASTVVDDVGVLTICGDEDHINQDDIIRLVRNALNPLILDVFLNSVAPVFSVPLAALNQINVFGVGGNDDLIVDIVNGLIDIPDGIRYDGDGICTVAGDDQSGLPDVVGVDRGIDTLTLTGDLEQTTETIIVGALPGTGVDTIVGPDGSQTVYFEELEPIVSLVPAIDLNINGGAIGSLLNADNAINYRSSDILGATGGMVTIDEFEPIHFTSKVNLTIDAEAGSDTINLNNSDTPTDLTTITVDGGDPTASSDVVIVNGTAGTDTVTIDQLTADGATVTGLGPVINVTTAERLAYDSQGGADDLTVETPDRRLDRIQVFPGVNPGDGEIAITDPSGNDLLGVQFEDLDSGNNASTLTLQDADAARSDDLVYWGTDSIDEFTVNPGGFFLHRESFLISSSKLFVTMATPGVRSFGLVGRGGADLVHRPW